MEGGGEHRIGIHPHLIEDQRANADPLLEQVVVRERDTERADIDQGVAVNHPYVVHHGVQRQTTADRADFNAPFKGLRQPLVGLEGGVSLGHIQLKHA